MTLAARLALKNASTAEITRRGLVVALRLFAAASLPALVLWLPPLLLAAAAVALLESVDSETVFWLNEGLFAAWAILTAPLLSGMLARSAIRTGGGAKLKAGSLWREAMAGPGRGTLLGAGALTLAGFGLFAVPGYLARVMLFVLGPVCAVEGSSGRAALARSAELTRGHRWTLLGVLVLIGAVEAIVLRVSMALVPAAGTHHVPDLAVATALAAFGALFASLFFSASAAIAYNDLRVGRENLAVDALVEMLGGAANEHGDGALSDRAIARLSARPDREDATPVAVSLGTLEQHMKRRARLARRVGLALGGLAAAGIATAGVLAWMQRRERQEAIDAAEHAVTQAWTDWERTKEAPARESERAVAERIGRKIAGLLVAADGRERQVLAGRLMRHHADHYYGPGFQAAFARLGEDGAVDEPKMLAALDAEIRHSGCASALEAARAEPSTFAERCPPGGGAPLVADIPPAAPLWRVALVTLLELRASDTRLRKDALHVILRDTLVAR